MYAPGIVTVAVSTLVACAAAASDSEPFSIYAYGPGMGGLPIFSAGGDIFVGNFSRVNNSEAAPVQFTAGDNAWFGSPNTTGYASGRDPTWSNYTFAVPGPSSSSHSVKLINDTTDTDDYVSNLVFYGTFVMVEENGELTSLWYGTPSGTDGVYSIGWNASDAGSSDDKVVVTLKRTPPSNQNHNRL
ncbi:hypothetical protein FSARC_11158 [Fusarium sarcochroum]|uniref:Uncharacterized protein n=1 Tax=Fusarium sarcochroum TaxID=1208366 RepID=A0A8H4TH80_9HYPO|nr:hypothetical protein FSARC_11158 [Fusarium sarcochroum]